MEFFKNNILARFIIILFPIIPVGACAKSRHIHDPGNPPIPIQFTLNKAGYVTLVIEKPNGVRVRNLVANKWFDAGQNVVYWDGLDDLARDSDAARHGVYRIPAHFVDPGDYRVRGLFHDAIVPRYEFPVYTPGNPAWDTPNHTGGWIGNHSAPQAALFVPANQSPTGQPAVYLGCYVTEGPDGLAWVDLDGRKLGGKKWIGGNWTTAPFMCRDAGSNANTANLAYVASSWQTGAKLGSNEIRITALTKGADKPVLHYQLDTAGVKIDQVLEIGGIAVNNNIAVLSLAKRNQLLFVDVNAGKVNGTAPVNAPAGLTFDARGRLLVLSANSLLRYTINSSNHLSEPEQLVTIGLEAPYGLTLDSQGNIYISDDGSTNQVKVFSSSGKFLLSIGKSGPSVAGLYDPLHMNNPAGITIDSKNQLWVTERDFTPKRVSVWSLDGKLINAFYGPAKYGGGGTFDSRDKSNFFYSGNGASMEFKLDWQKGSFKLDRVFYRPLPTDLQLGFRSEAPETPLYHFNRRYFTNCFNTNPVGGAPTAFLFIDTNNIAKPVAAAGSANFWDVLKGPQFSSRWPPGVNVKSVLPRDMCFFIWTDNNGDGQAQPEEVTIRKSVSQGVTIMPDLSFCIAGLDGKAASFLPVNFQKNGTPQYDIDKFNVLATGVLPPASSGGSQLLTGTNGFSVITLGIKPYKPLSISGIKNGAQVWSYPDMWPGLHASHESPTPDDPGELVGTTRILGELFTINGSDAGQCFAINGNEGAVYLFTTDGLFVSSLFSDKRIGKRWAMPTAIRGMSLDSISLSEENFFPTITQTADGSIYMVDGDRSCIVSFDGLESIHRLPDINLNVSKNDLVSANDYFIQTEAQRQQVVSTHTLTVALNGSPVLVDGNLDDWAGADWADIDKSGVKAYFNSKTTPYNIKGAVKITAGNLYLAYQTGITTLANSGEAPTAPFITGQALDLMIGTDPSAQPNRQKPVEGDMRLVITTVHNKPWAMLYRAVVKAAAPENRVQFSSPWRTITFDKVEDVSSQVQFASKNGNYEISIPLSVLGLRPVDGMQIQGDLGIILGGYGFTTSRSYWSNKSSGINADLPSEAELDPNLWGTWQIKSQ